MKLAAELVIVLVAFLHLYFLVLEMFLWDKPQGRRVFRLSAEYAAATRVLAANQGLYNGFLAAGLLWGLYIGSMAVQLFFLLCVMVAGVFGGATVGRKVLLVQALPAVVAVVLRLLAPV